MVDREEGKLQPVRHPDLVEDIRQVVLDGLDADRKLLRDVAVRIAADDGGHNLEFASGEAKGRTPVFRAARRGSVAHRVNDRPHTFASHPILAVHDRANALEQQVAGVGLHDDATGAELQRFDHIGFGNFYREENCSRRLRHRRQLAERFQTRRDRHDEIEQQDVGLQLPHEPDRLAAVARLADDVKRRIAFEQLA